MAKVVITIEDIPDGKVKVIATPNFAEMMQMDQCGNGLTSAQGYAVFALNEIRKRGQRPGPNRILLPRIARS